MARYCLESPLLRRLRSSNYRARPIFAAGFLLGLAGCSEELPEDVGNYRNRCLLIAKGIPKTEEDPHEGVKNVYACRVPLETVRSFEPFPDGTLIVKESTRSDADFPWLVATARKVKGTWLWNEYSRNFSDEPFLSILPGEQVCIDCHKKAAPLDWIYTRLSAPP